MNCESGKITKGEYQGSPSETNKILPQCPAGNPGCSQAQQDGASWTSMLMFFVHVFYVDAHGGTRDRRNPVCVADSGFTFLS